MRLAKTVVGLGQPVALGWAGVAAQQLLHHPLADLEWDTRVVAHLVDRFAEHVLRQDPDALPRRQIRALGDVGGLDRDVHRRVAHPQDHDALAGEDRVVDVGVRMQLAAVERVCSWERRFGPARIPVVAVGDQQRVVAAALARVELDRPHAVRVAAGVLDAGLEGDCRRSGRTSRSSRRGSRARAAP